MHLTNYAINKKSERFVKSDGGEDQASKRPLEWFFGWLEKVFDGKMGVVVDVVVTILCRRMGTRRMRCGRGSMM